MIFLANSDRAFARHSPAPIGCRTGLSNIA
jgi:hypothetical protein